MGKIIKKVMGGVVAFVLVAIGAVFLLSNRALTVDNGAPMHGIAMAVPPPEDTVAVEEGGRLAFIYGCRDCHGPDLAGKLFIDEPAFMVLGSPNLTTGRGASPAVYSPELFERAVRHGVGSDDRNLVIMPAHEFVGMSDEAISKILAYARNTEQKAKSPISLSLGPAGRMAVLFAPEVVPARVIDHEATHMETKADGVSLEWGERYAAGCTGCHGPDFAGGRAAGAPQDAPDSPNITPGNPAIAAWTEEQFSNAVRAGVGSSGNQLHEWMPWRLLAHLTDDEVTSLWQYLQTLTALPDNPG
jgi:mono/diheme cytochrome c family protein